MYFLFPCVSFTNGVVNRGMKIWYTFVIKNSKQEYFFLKLNVPWNMHDKGSNFLKQIYPKILLFQVMNVLFSSFRQLLFHILCMLNQWIQFVPQITPLWNIHKFERKRKALELKPNTDLISRHHLRRQNQKHINVD